MKKILYILICLCALNFYCFGSDYALAKDSTPFEEGLKSAAVGTGHLAGNDATALMATDIIGIAISVVLTFLGVIFLILLIYGGYLWMTAQGNETQAEKAKKILTDSIIGLVIALAAYAITRFFYQEIVYYFISHPAV